VFKLPLFVSLLLGSIVASTDAAAVFSIIGARNLKLKGNITPLLELESGSNDPMAVFLTISFLSLITGDITNLWMLGLNFVLEMGIGLLLGVVLGKLMVQFINWVKFPIEGFYTVFVLAAAISVYSLTALLHGSGFLAVYIAGIVLNHHNFVFKKNIFRFFDGLAWLSQIAMFLTLGLLVFPSQILPAIKTELIISFFLIFIARPIGVFISLIGSEFKMKEKFFISWVGLRGAVPIILATFPMIVGIREAQWIFNVVFFIVITSAFLQGWSIPWIASWLRLDMPANKKLNIVTEFGNLDETNRALVDFIIPENSTLVKKPIVEIPELKGILIVTVKREKHYFVPSGGTILETGDELQMLVANEKLDSLKLVFERKDL
jgi:cell volume regulation protein A